MRTLFFDTYALIALTQAKPEYELYKDSVVITTIFNLTELYYFCLREYGREKAQETYLAFEACAVPVSSNVIFDAMALRLRERKRHLSYADCIGYAAAVAQNTRFLTGDREFKEMNNVEFCAAK